MTVVWTWSLDGGGNSTGVAGSGLSGIGQAVTGHNGTGAKVSGIVMGRIGTWWTRGGKQGIGFGNCDLEDTTHRSAKWQHFGLVNMCR